MIAEVATITETAAPAAGRFARKCKCCGDEFRTDRREAEFCGDKCRKGWHNLAMTRGRDLYPLVMVWRDQSAANAENAKEAFSAICRLVGEYRRLDAENGTPRRYDSVKTVKARLAHIFNTIRLGTIRAGR